MSIDIGTVISAVGLMVSIIASFFIIKGKLDIIHHDITDIKKRIRNGRE